MNLFRIKYFLLLCYITVATESDYVLKYNREWFIRKLDCFYKSAELLLLPDSVWILLFTAVALRLVVLFVRTASSFVLVLLV